MTTKPAKTKKQKSRWTAPGQNPERYTRADAALLKKIHEENGWRFGARVQKK